MLAGALFAVSLGRSFEALLFGLDPLDPISLAAGVAVLLAAAIAAAVGPARLAASVDPVQALRAD